MYTMMQVCKETNMTYQTLKFYCNEGLIPNVKRDKNNRRVFDDHNVAWIKSLACLKNCGMSIQDMKTYLEFCLKGPATIPERKQILSEKRLELLGKIDELYSAIDYINQKQEFYDGVLSGEIPYISNLVPADSN